MLILLKLVSRRRVKGKGNHLTKFSVLSVLPLSHRRTDNQAFRKELAVAKDAFEEGGVVFRSFSFGSATAPTRAAHDLEGLSLKAFHALTCSSLDCELILPQSSIDTNTLIRRGSGLWKVRKN